VISCSAATFHNSKTPTSTPVVLLRLEPPSASDLPSDENATDEMPVVAAVFRDVIRASVDTFHNSRTAPLLANPPAARVLPSDDIATELTYVAAVLNVAFSFRVGMFHSSSAPAYVPEILLSPPAASVLPSVEKATELTP